MITKEVLTQRLSMLQTQREQTLANANAIAGAIAIVEELLAGLDAPNSSPED